MLQNIQKLKYFQDFLSKKNFSSIITISKDENINFSFYYYDKEGYKVNIEIDTQKQVEKVIDISIIALKNILDLNISFNDFLPDKGFDSSLDSDF